MSVKTIVDLITATPGTNDKISILKKNSNNEELKNFFKLSCDKRIKFGIKLIPEYETSEVSLTLQDAFDALEPLTTREIVGNSLEGKEYVSNILSLLSDDDAEMLKLVLQKDPMCGVKATTINKVWKNLIRDKSYMRCELSSNIEMKAWPFPSLLQVKMDGKYSDTFTNVVGIPLCESREGVQNHFLGAFDDDVLMLNNAIDSLFPGMGLDDMVLMGELTAVDSDGNPLPRSISNGICSKASDNNQSISEEEAQKIILTVWDVVPKSAHDEGSWNVTYETRYNMLKDSLESLEGLCTKIKLVQTEVVNSWEEAFKINSQWQKEGKEGSVLKKLSLKYKNGTSKDQVKLKVKFECTLEVVGFEEGTKTNKGSLGAVLLRSSCGNLEAECGSGWKLKKGSYDDLYIRQVLWNNRHNMMGRFLTVCANDVVKAKDSDIWRLSHCSLDLDVGGWRDIGDCSEADDLDKIQASLESAKMVKTNS